MSSGLHCVDGCGVHQRCALVDWFAVVAPKCPRSFELLHDSYVLLTWEIKSEVVI